MLHRLHRMSAFLIGSFILFHLINHLFIIGGAQAHIDVMEAFREVYRHVVVEAALLTCILFQIVSGLYFVRQRWRKRSGFIEKAQAFSGLYLAFFFLNHIGAVLYGRMIADVDTNIYYGIAGFHNPPFQFYFIPYYFLAVVAIFVHVSAAFNWLCRDKIAAPLRLKLVYTIMASGCGLGVVLILGFSDQFNEIVIPEPYNSPYQ